jgi:YesN/AraC family two-component response regulator
MHFWGPVCDYYYRQFLSANGGRPDGEMFTGNLVASHIYALMELYRNKHGGMDLDLQASALLTSVMAECIRAVSGKTENMSTRYVRQAQDFIMAHFREKVTLDTLAEHILLNKFYIQKLFKQLTGKTPNAYLASIRINHAKELLRTTEMPIATVALESGIENTSYFIRLFKSFEGMPPGEYRNNWRIHKKA